MTFVWMYVLKTAIIHFFMTVFFKLSFPFTIKKAVFVSVPLRLIYVNNEVKLGCLFCLISKHGLYGLLSEGYILNLSQCLCSSSNFKKKVMTWAF